MNRLLRLASWLARLNRPLPQLPYWLLAGALAALAASQATGQVGYVGLAITAFFLSLLSALRVWWRRVSDEQLQFRR